MHDPRTRSRRLGSTTTVVVALLLGIGVDGAPHAHSAAPGLAPAERGGPAARGSRGPRSADAFARPSAAIRAQSPGVWREDQVVVAPEAGVSLEQIAASFGGTVLRQVGASGYGAIALPSGTELDRVMTRLQRDARVADVGLNAVVFAASEGSTAPMSPADYQWWRASSDLPASTSTTDYSSWVVAVLDTGVAFEDHNDGQHSYVRAPSLSASPIIPGWDFVNGDAHANDDHQHGTHIASIIASANDSSVVGQISGVAPGVGLMPVKVLDSAATGTELDLVEGIYFAVDNGADVINMSLSFRSGYVLSGALSDALVDAWNADAILIAATGNQGLNEESWPAASPLVLGVGAATLKDSNEQLGVAAYSNRSLGVDLVATGGSMSLDRNRDGQRDGILAETIQPGDPSQVGYWFYAGTSQAAAVVSGAVIQLLAAGASPEQVRPALHLSAGSLPGQNWTSGYGAGSLSVAEALTLVQADPASLTPAHRYSAAILPALLAGDGDTVRPAASVTVVDELGSPAANVTVYVPFSGTSSSRRSCVTGSDGTCRVVAPDVASVVLGVPQPIAVAASVPLVIDADGLAQSPTSAFFLSDSLEVLAAALAATPDAAQSVLALRWSAGTTDPVFGDVADAYTVMNLGQGLSSSPLGVVFNPAALGFASISNINLDLDGTGLSSSPLGILPIRVLTLDGSGLSSSPLGLFGLRLATFEGSGLSSSPLGFSAWDLVLSGRTSGCCNLGLDGVPVINGLDGSGLSSSPLGVSLLDTHIGARIASGGELTSSGAGVADALVASGALGIPAGATAASLEDGVTVALAQGSEEEGTAELGSTDAALPEDSAQGDEAAGEDSWRVE